jgi:hypothetical protein
MLIKFLTGEVVGETWEGGCKKFTGKEELKQARPQ